MAFHREIWKNESLCQVNRLFGSCYKTKNLGNHYIGNNMKLYVYNGIGGIAGSDLNETK